MALYVEAGEGNRLVGERQMSLLDKHETRFAGVLISEFIVLINLSSPSYNLLSFLSFEIQL